MAKKIARTKKEKKMMRSARSADRRLGIPGKPSKDPMGEDVGIVTVKKTNSLIDW